MAKTLFSDFMVVDDHSNPGFNFRDSQEDDPEKKTTDSDEDGNLFKSKEDSEEDIEDNGGEGGDGEEDEDEDEGSDEDEDESKLAGPKREIKAFHDIIVEQGLIEAIPDFDGDETVLTEHLERLPEQYFLQAVNEEVPGQYQQLLRYIFMNGEEASFDQVRGFFNQVVDPLVRLQDIDISNEEQAYEYLDSRLQKSKIFKTEDKRKKHLDELVAEGLLLSTAEEEYNDELSALEQASKKAVEDAEVAKKARLEQTKVFGQKVMKELEALPWAPELKTKAIDTLKPGAMQALYNKVFEHPSALLHLSAFLTHFNVATGQFDLTSFAKQVSSAKAQESKEKIQRASITSHLKGDTHKKEGRRFLSSFKPVN